MLKRAQRWDPTFAEGHICIHWQPCKPSRPRGRRAGEKKNTSNKKNREGWRVPMSNKTKRCLHDMQKPSKNTGILSSRFKTRVKKDGVFLSYLWKFIDVLLTHWAPMGGLGWTGSWQMCQTLPTEDAQKHGCTYSKKGTWEGNCLQQARNLPAKIFERQTV